MGLGCELAIEQRGRVKAAEPHCSSSRLSLLEVIWVSTESERPELSLGFTTYQLGTNFFLSSCLSSLPEKQRVRLIR